MNILKLFCFGDHYYVEKNDRLEHFYSLTQIEQPYQQEELEKAIIEKFGSVKWKIIDGYSK